ncbi:PREDICTED: protein TBATA isoform X2 [Chinchilla lanigera]|uniref:protein TBATA isoform X2 n=1 Tax=Chinchilla lanigera TaxID=34839 RepID=UPI00038EC596|nr:PREDICTED: protein TBATA isoform X2 [Chinchilla lanigera]
MAAEVRTQLAEHPLTSPRAELKPEKKSGHRPQSHGDGGPQKEPVTPGIVDLELNQEVLRTLKPRTAGSYRFGRLSHHSFFSRHHPHPQHVTHIQDLTGKPVCVVRDEFSLTALPQFTPLPRCLMGMPIVSVPIGDPQSNRNPQLPSQAWKRELKELASRVAVFTKETELKNKEEKEEPQRDQGAKYSAETGRLIPTSIRALSSRKFRQGHRSHPSSRDGGAPASLLQDQELLGVLNVSGIRFSGPVGRGRRADPGAPLPDSADGFTECHPVLATLCTPSGERPRSRTPADSGGSTPPPTPRVHSGRNTLGPASRSSRTTSREAAASLQSIPEENKVTTSAPKRKTSVHRKSPSPPGARQQRPRGERVQAKGRELRTAKQS